MSANHGRVQVVARILLAAIVVIVAGFWGLISLFSDTPPAWFYASWVLYLFTGNFIAGMLIGILLPLHWRLCIAASWGAILVSVTAVVGKLRPNGSITGRAEAVPLRFGFPLLTLLVVLGAVTLGGYAGSRIMIRLPRSSASSRGTDESSNAI